MGDPATLALLEQRWQQTTTLLTLIGPAGCGKTSLVQAYLIPLVKQNAHVQGRSPGLLKLSVTTDPLAQLEQCGLQGASMDLLTSIKLWNERYDYDQTVLILDHYEEFLRSASSEVQTQFVEQIVRVLQRRAAVIVLVLRDSSYALLARQQGLMRYVEQNLVNVVAPHRRSDLLALAHKQARKHNYALSRELAETILDQVMCEQSQLSLFSRYQLRLAGIWAQHKQPSVLAREPVRAISTVEEHFEQLFHSLSLDEQSYVQRIVLQLVDVNEKRFGITLPLRHLSILNRGPDHQQVLSLCIEQGLFLVRIDPDSQQEMIALASDVLLYEWSRLRTWIEEEQQFQLWYASFQRQVQLSEPFLTGGTLLMAEAWRQRTPERLTSQEHRFIDSCLFAQQQKQVTEQHAQLSKARMLVATAQELYQQPMAHFQGLQLAIEAHELSPSAEADQALRHGIVLLPQLLHTYGDGRKMRFLALSAQGRFVAFVRDQVQLLVLELATAQIYAEFYTNGTPIVQAHFNDDETLLGTVSEDGMIHLWDLLHQQHIMAVQKAGVKSLLFSPQNRYLMTVHSNTKRGWTELYDLVKGEHLPRRNHATFIQAVAFRSDGGSFAVGGDDGQVYLWPVQSTTSLPLISHSASIHTILFSPGGQYIVTASQAGGVAVCQIPIQSSDLEHQSAFIEEFPIWEERRLLFSIQHPTVRIVQFSPHGTYLVTAGSDGSASIWQLPDGTALHTFSFPLPITQLNVSANEQYVAIGLEDGTVYVWDLIVQQEIKRVFHPAPLIAQLFSPHQNQLITVCSDQKVRIWDLFSAPLVKPVLHSSSMTINAIVRNPQKDGASTLAVGCREGTIYVLTQEYLPHLPPLQLPPDEAVDRLLFSPDGQHLVATDKQGGVYVWSVATEQLIVHYRHQEYVTALAFSPTGRYLLTAGKERTVLMYHLKDDRLQDFLSNRQVSHLAFSPDERYLVLATPDGCITLWMQNEHEGYRELAIQQASVLNALAWGDTYFVTAHNNEAYARLWRWGPTIELYDIDLPHEGPVYALALSPDESLIATASSDALLWDAQTGFRRALLPHHSTVEALAFSSDGNYLVTASVDEYVRVWDIATEQKIVQLHYPGLMPTIMFSPDDRYIVTAQRDGSIDLWLWQPKDMLEVARSF
ncbi:hypothetical protein KTT_58260 [Tengunoibacter tsumagoiensis]|uniref:Novel STAND NTPase 1 domain-containing protein n=1 Tax=Tengunoibacter tsumagoiensis TaxID=2014871 RepID=A0A402A9W4_9CHLR|nr:hypothetical protein KTT_58260 [Tengunoibacter tsumagoiensis]